MIHLSEQRHAGGAWQHFLEQGEALPGNVVGDHRHASDVAAGSAEALDESALHGVD